VWISFWPPKFFGLQFTTAMSTLYPIGTCTRLELMPQLFSDVLPHISHVKIE
jgi:hypothetical protein